MRSNSRGQIDYVAVTFVGSWPSSGMQITIAYLKLALSLINISLAILPILRLFNT